MNYEVAEQQIVDRLNQWFAGKNLSEQFVAAVMPETVQDAEDFEALHPRARVAVEYQDSTFQPSQSLGTVKQVETVRFRLLYEHELMRGEGGLFSMLAETKNCLVGFRLTGSTNALTIAGNGKQEFHEGVWLPYLDFECKTEYIQAWEDSDEVGGNLYGLNYQ